ncbi:CagY family CD-EC repeat-containing protein [Rhodococcus xishaensis]|uniref:Uncharacterized protein n=1 Tax=Rhodococcus xishaensis TaxID=2487364 RepID=A0A438AVX5_9NOCA|nr:CagY family CD-EC repeat-containing protein [Rhodococcus xishaensis]RVW02881.1 hypothetical protein EGT50_09090 [Rhodococcus xishaensis]
MTDEFSQYPGAQMVQGRQSPTQQANEKDGMSGVLLGVLAMIGGLVGIVIVFATIEQFGDEQTQISNDWNAYTECIRNADTPEEKSACS